ncbi:NAD(P)H-quinone oxidoreductase subunit F [Dactylococcopsis salina]|uniref:NAD(P)H dehydrogenase, subunit NdhF3 family n=1 Tax=Dactylococcopsis salina (strain PCC 8305) TaxID=13035 RepID=K9YV74_DACS8|nr:NAD(P)H-quinone oxidoreductase subunit F [Dactylococcopsis salina]AFZ50422.1 NAD(P)H dehydrogenase, subunit NdhF3 family [Dactylococcopsis salina PCC 8305]
MGDLLVQGTWLIPFYGLFGALLTLPWSMRMIRRTGSRPAAYVNLLLSAIAFLHGSIVLWLTWEKPPQEIVWHWLKVADLDLTLAIEISPVSIGALELVSGITVVTLIYGLGYLEKDWSLGRFYGLMGFFAAALSGIALSDSLLLTYGLLELLTLSTYLLVGFWYAQPLVVTAARDAFLTKRVGDIILLMGVVALSSYGVDLTFTGIEEWSQTADLAPFSATLLGLALIAGPIGKCAQFPLNLWLDEAMEAPSPASLMRNSIVVTSGAYVLIKLHPIFELSPIVREVLIAVGLVTAVGASFVAIAQIDIKRTLSHSTSVYLGLVFVAVGFGRLDIALLLLLIHAIAKTLMFMSVGAIIFTTNDQNITQMGGLWSKMPVTALSFLVGSSGLVVLLPLGNFWVMGQWIESFNTLPQWLLPFVMLINALSAINLTRVFRLVFLGETQPKTRRAPEVSWPMAFPMVALIIIALLAPLIPQKWQLWFAETGSLATTVEVINQPEMLLLVLSGFVGVILGGTIALPRTWMRPVSSSSRFLQDFLAYDFYLERVYRWSVVLVVELASKFSAWLDRYIIDGIVNLIGFGTLFSGQSLKYSASGQSQFYLLTILISGALLLMLLINWSF